MGHYNTIMSQLLIHIPRHQFQNLVESHHGDSYTKKFTTWGQLITLLYAQASGKDSLRDIQNGMAVQSGRLYHLGLPERICRSTLCDANAKRDWRIFEGLFYRLLDRCRSITPKHQFRFKNPLYTLDATVIDLCVSMFPWAKYQRIKGALRLHYQFDHAGHLPSFLTITDGKRHEISVAKETFAIVPDSIYCFDKGYTDASWFRRIHQTKAFFVTRLKKDIAYRVIGQHSADHKKDILLDTSITLSKSHLQPIRLIRYYDSETEKTFDFITNNFKLSASTIAQIYKARWQIESFFKWIKQNLKIKTFLGTSKNAVLSQIWIAMCYYLILSYIKYQSRYRFSLFYLHRLIRQTIFDRISIIDLLNLNEKRLIRLKGHDPQLCLGF